MRDYTRKAKIKDSNEWVIGYHVYVDYLDKHYILASEKTHDGFSGMLAMKQYEVDGNTICNPTGLTDKNGNKIWENDICSTDIKRPYAVVEFRNGCFMYNLNDGEEDYYDIMTPVEPLVDSDKYTEVIGNTFDNADLLKGE